MPCASRTTADNCTVHGTWIVRLAGVTEIEAGVCVVAAIVRVNVFEPLWPPLVARTVNVKVPFAVGVPLIVPVPAPSESPPGSDPLVTAQA